MREIKFRAWDLTKKKMIQSLDNMEICDGKIIVGTWNYEETEIVNEHEAILMQFTGLLDKNGKEIYEGDIVKIGYFSPIGTVYTEKEVRIEYGETYPFNKFWASGGNVVREYRNKNSEIIGNIYENKDLITNR